MCYCVSRVTQRVLKNASDDGVAPVVSACARFYYFLPLDDEKPCLWVKGSFEDHRKRMFNTNILEKIAEKLVCIKSILPVKIII